MKDSRAQKLAYAKWYRETHKEQVKAAQKKWREANKERVKELNARWSSEHSEERREYMRQYKKRTYSKRYHGVDYTTYQAMCAAQNGLCQICQRARKLVVDHRHSDNMVRGLLCRSCNTALGLLNENHELFARCVLYLERRLV